MDLTPNSLWRKFINDEFMMEKYSDFRKWFFREIPDWEREKIKNDYYKHLGITQEFIRFVEWFITYFLDQNEKDILTLKSRSCILLGKMSLFNLLFLLKKV